MTEIENQDEFSDEECNAQLSDIQRTDNEVQFENIDVNNYYRSLVVKENEMKKTINFWQQSINETKTALSTMAIEKQNVETKAATFEKELDRVNAELQRTIKKRIHSSLD